MAEEYQELSYEERLELASRFLIDAPPGEMNDVIRDVSSFFKGDEALEPYLLKYLKQYHNENYFAVEVENNENGVLVTQFNNLDDELYFDPRTQKKFNFDPASNAIEFTEDYVHNEELEELRVCVQKELDEYTTQYYPDGRSLVIPEGRELKLIIVGVKLSQKNYWNGRLKSTWSYNLDTQELKGSIKGHVHYYEEGNVQLHSDKQFNVNIPFNEDNNIFASSLLKKIQTLEQSYQLALNEGYLHLNDTAFKGLRRPLPITKSKLDWNQIFSYKIGSEINK